MKAITTIICALTVLFAASQGMAASAPAAEFTHLSEPMIVFENDNNRVFALNTTGGIVVIDTGSSVAAMTPIKAAIEREFQRADYAYVINTHHHPEHIGGNALFASTRIVAQDGSAQGYAEITTNTPAMIAHAEKGLAKLQQQAATLSPESAAGQNVTGQIDRTRSFIEQLKRGYVLPNVTFRDRLTLELGDRTVVLIAVGKGHSYSDSFVYIPQDGVLLTGGRAHLGRLPPAGIGKMSDAADIDRFIRVLDDFVDTGVQLRHILSGHNKPVTQADLTFVRDYFHVAWDGLKQAKAAGQTLDEAKRTYALQATFGDWPQFANPTATVVLNHNQNLEAMWSALQRSAEPVVPRSTAHE